MKKTYALIIICVGMIISVIVSASIKTKDTNKGKDDACQLSGPLASKLINEWKDAEKDAEYYLVSIGEVKRNDRRTFIVLKEKYAPGLISLDEFSHVMVFYWFHKNDSPKNRSLLQFNRARKKDPLTGIFATRSAVRPNLIAFSTCKIISIKKNIIEIEGIDAFNDSPILDLKPYIPRNDSYPEARIPEWVN